MALFLLYRTRPEDRSPNGVHSMVVQAADVTAARTAAGVPSSWASQALASLTDGTVIKIEGDAVSLLGVARNGNPCS